MLLTTLLAEHPSAIVDIVRQTPAWVAALLGGLVYLGISASRDRDVHIGRLLLMPVAMGAMALWGVESAFNGTGRLPELLAVWAAGYAALLALGLRLPVPAGVRYSAAERRFPLPGSWLPMGLILAVFLLKYAIGVQLAMEPTIATHPGFAYPVAAVYGLLSGIFAARTLRVLRLLRGPATAAAA